MPRTQKPVPTNLHALAACAIIYIRVSTSRQLDGASLETQERACREFCERNGWQVVRVFREEGESAKTADRTEFTSLRQYCRTANPRPDYVVVYSLDRFARNGQDHDKVRAELLALRVKLRCVQTPLGENPYEKAVERILSTLPQLDNELRAERSVAGMKTRLEGGRWTFKAPLGYINGRDASGNKTLLPDPERAPRVTEAFELFATGLHTKEEIRARVIALGLRTLEGKEVSSESFDRMLRNPRYAGLLTVGTWDIEAEGNYQPLVSMDTFRRVQDILAGRRVSITARQRNNPDFPLRNFIRCGHCHRPLTASWSKGKMGAKYAYYHCQNRRCASPVNVRRQDLEDTFVEFLREQQPDPGYLRLFHKVIVDVWNGKQADAVALVRKFEKQVDELKERKRKLNKAYVFDQAIRRDDYEEMRAALAAELDDAEWNLSQARVDEMEVDKVLDFAENLLANTGEAWQRCSPVQRQRLQQVLFPQGVEYADGVYRTQETSFLFKGLKGIQTVEEGFGSATGNRTRV